MNTLERIRRELEALPPEKQEEVADFIAYLRQRYSPKGAAPVKDALLRHAGRLRGSPHLNQDPLKLQRELRDEW